MAEPISDPQGERVRTESHRLLVIEDDPMMRELITKMLQSVGLEADCAETGDEGLRLCFEKPYDLVLLDVYLPGMNGFDVLARIRERHSTLDLPVILLTGQDGSESMVRGFELGASDYVTKPFHFQVVLARIRYQLSLKAQGVNRSMAADLFRTLEPGALFGPYRILELLGQGGAGTVFKALDTRLDRMVALKTLAPYLSLDQDKVARFQQEARIIAQIKHPRIVSVYEVGEEPLNYFTMEYVEGEPLNAFRRRHDPSPHRSARMVAEVANALSAAHERGIIHRDVKLSNIMVDKLHLPRLTDFGTAKFVESEQPMTRTDAMVGTPCCMAPEQIDSSLGSIDARSDVYGLGAVLYELLSGHPPFSGSPVRVMWQAIHMEPLDPCVVRSGIPKKLARICLKALAKDKQRRFSSAREMEHAILEWSAAPA